MARLSTITGLMLIAVNFKIDDEIYDSLELPCVPRVGEQIHFFENEAVSVLTVTDVYYTVEDSVMVAWVQLEPVSPWG